MNSIESVNLQTAKKQALIILSKQLLNVFCSAIKRERIKAACSVEECRQFTVGSVVWK